ncbi:MAG TPA: phage major capsid protein, partial [Epulopiscium sp.]|nr:phage major capsid protein [Candidatus Epulonipiscium sp.]
MGLNLQHFAGVPNPDLVNQKKDEIMQKMNGALKEGNEEVFAQAFTEFADHLQQSIIGEARAVVQTTDTNVLIGRGVRQLTSDEKNFYQKTIEAMRSASPKQALTDLSVVMPETVIDAVFDDLKAEHELLSVIDFKNTSGIVKMLLNTNGNQLATWDKLCTEIVTELTSGFKMVDMTLNKLSAFIPVCKDMLDLGPTWLDRYVRTILAEAIAFGLEKGIIDGTGKDQPIGMNRQVGDDVTVTGGVYPVKDTVAVTSLEPVEYGAILSKLAKVVKGKDEDDNDIEATRQINNVLMIVNPVDYLNKIMPATTIRGTDGLYRSDVLPFPTKIVQSVFVPTGKAIIGLADKYFMGIGTA